jgi:hypothetical protein
MPEGSFPRSAPLLASGDAPVTAINLEIHKNIADNMHVKCLRDTYHIGAVAAETAFTKRLQPKAIAIAAITTRITLIISVKIKINIIIITHN